MNRVLRELRNSQRKNRDDIRGWLFGAYPTFVFNGRLPALAGEVPVFAFHTVKPERFQRQLGYLQANSYSTLESADAFYAWLRGERTVPPNTVLLTFDDGRESLYRVAFPLLRRFGMRAVSFVVPTFIGQERFCTWDQLREMDASGTIDVQSHTMFHRFAPDWPRVVPCERGELGLQADDMARYPSMVDDYRRAREVLNERLRKDVRHLCYPDYDGTDASVSAAAQAGYVSNYWGVVAGRRTNRAGDDPFRISRLQADYLPCLPGRGRRSAWSVVRERWAGHGGGLVTRLFRPKASHGC